MKKFAIVILLLAVIAVSYGFVWLKKEALGAETNYFNQHWRQSFATQPWLRSVLGLHNDGDGRADYLGRHYKKILIEVDLMDNLSIRLAGLKLLASRIEALTGKPTSYVISDENIPYARRVTDADIARIAATYRNDKNHGDTATLYLMYLSRYQDKKTLIGLTYQEFGIVLFGDALTDFTASRPYDVVGDYEESTALHEFGHQLGLPHNQEPGCLMQEKAETNDQAKVRPEDVITDFCQIEKDLIHQL